MLIVDASCLFERLTRGPLAAEVGALLDADPRHAAPHVVDVEVFGIVRRELMLGRLDQTAAAQAISNLGAWSGRRVGHTLLLSRAWELRENVRGWDAMYVALAEAFDATLVTADRRLAAAPGPRCPVALVGTA